MKELCIAALLAWVCLADPPRSSPGYPDYQKAEALFAAKKLPECAAELDAALKLDPKLVPALTLKTKLSMALNQYEAARQSIDRALALEPGSEYVQFLAGFEAYIENNLQTALPHLEKARQLDPSDSRAALYLGLTSESLGKPEEALALYREAARLEKAADRPQAGTLLAGARLMLLSNLLDECGNWLRQALALAPGSRDAHFEMARLLLAKGDAAHAAAEGERAMALSDGEVTDIQIHYLLVRAYRENGQQAEAERHAEALRALEK